MMNEHPIVSVIVPVYKAENTLEKCVNSILSQNLTNLEIILVEDGSPDRSGEVCEDLARKDDRIRVLHKENGGAASARNMGIDNAKGSYIGFVDSDDYIAPDMYETLMKLLEDHNLPYIDSSKIILKNNVLSNHVDTDSLKTVNGEEAIGHLLDWTGNSSLCTRLFRAEVFKDGFRIPVGKRVEDFIFCIRLFDKYQIDATYDHAFYYVVSHEESVTQSGGGSIFLDALYYANEAEELVLRKYPSLKEKASFFRLYCIGQLFINSRQEEYELYRDEYRLQSRYLKKHIGDMLRNNYLSKLYKIVLLISCVNYRLPAIIYRNRVSSHGKKKNLFFS